MPHGTKNVIQIYEVFQIFSLLYTVSYILISYVLYFSGSEFFRT